MIAYLHDYETGKFIRRATSIEYSESCDAARHDGGAGVILVDGRRCYVQAPDVESQAAKNVADFASSLNCGIDDGILDPSQFTSEDVHLIESAISHLDDALIKIRKATSDN